MALMRLGFNLLRGVNVRFETCGLVIKPWDSVFTKTIRDIHNTAPIWSQRISEAQKQERELQELNKIRTKIIPVETSIQYLESKAYQETYGNNPVWKEYRRNHKGPFAPPKTRKTCIRQEKISAGNPCPICRDEYLVLDYRNIELLKQFICPHTGSILSYSKTGLCQKKHQQLVIAIQKARDYGFLVYDVPHRVYDYSEYIRQ